MNGLRASEGLEESPLAVYSRPDPRSPGSLFEGIPQNA